MEPERSCQESKITTSWTQTSRPCTPLDVLVTRPYIADEQLHLPLLIQSVEVSITTPTPTAENKCSLTKIYIDESKYSSGDHTKTVKHVKNFTARQLQKPETDTLDIKGNVPNNPTNVTTDTRTLQTSKTPAPRELNTTPLSFFSKKSVHCHSQVSGHSGAFQTYHTGMSTGETPAGSSLPVANLKRDATLVRNVRNKHSISELNALRNKFKNYDQYRLTKRKTVSSKAVHSGNDGIPQLAIGDFDFEKSRQYNTLGRNQETEIRSDPKINSSEPRRKEFMLTRSKTYGGPSRIDETSASPFTRETDRDGILCEVKGLHKESHPLNHNTPHAELLSPRDTDRTRMPNVNKYFNGSGPDPSKMVGIAVGNGVIIDNTRKTVKSSGRRFREKKNSKLVLKFYSDGSSKTKETLQLSQDTAFYNSARQTQPDTAKCRSFKENLDVSELGKTGVRSIQPTVPDVDKPISLTTKNLELFDHLTSTHEKSKCEKVSEESDSDVNAKVMDWLVQGKLLSEEQTNDTFKTTVNKQVIQVAL